MAGRSIQHLQRSYGYAVQVDQVLPPGVVDQVSQPDMDLVAAHPCLEAGQVHAEVDELLEATVPEVGRGDAGVPGCPEGESGQVIEVVAIHGALPVNQSRETHPGDEGIAVQQVRVDEAALV